MRVQSQGTTTPETPANGLAILKVWPLLMDQSLRSLREAKRANLVRQHHRPIFRNLYLWDLETWRFGEVEKWRSGAVEQLSSWAGVLALILFRREPKDAVNTFKNLVNVNLIVSLTVHDIKGCTSRLKMGLPATPLRMSIWKFYQFELEMLQ